MTPRNMPYPTYLATCGHSGSNNMGTITEICQKIGPSYPVFQGQSRSLEPT